MNQRLGAFDLYALFIERGYSLLKPTGRLCYIVPHKFFQASFGEALRGILTDRKALTQVVRFGAERVFEESTTYTCLLFLSASPSEHFDLIEVKTLEGANEMLRALGNRETHESYSFDQFPAPSSTHWDFSIGTSDRVLKRLSQHGQTLGDITRKIFVGLQTSLDRLYVLGIIESRKDSYFCRCKLDDSQIEIERGLVKPFLLGRDVHRFEPPEPKHVVIFPYIVNEGRASLMSQAYIKKHYRHGWRFLKKHEHALANRERGKMIGESFYAYVYPKNLTEFEVEKIMTPDICGRPEMTLDESGTLYHTTTLYSFAFNDRYKASPRFLLGLLNSKVLWYFLAVTGTPLRGGYLRFKTEYLRPFPVPDSTPQQQRTIETFVEYVLRLRKASAATRETRNQMASAYFEQIIDALVYELYFPEEFSQLGDSSLHGLLKGEDLPRGSSSLGKIREFFDKVFTAEHPIRKALFFIDSRETIQVIESKSRENYKD